MPVNSTSSYHTMEDGAQLVVLEREEVDIPWGFNVVPCPDGVARITQVGKKQIN